MSFISTSIEVKFVGEGLRLKNIYNFMTIHYNMNNLRYFFKCKISNSKKF